MIAERLPLASVWVGGKTLLGVLKMPPGRGTFAVLFAWTVLLVVAVPLHNNAVAAARQERAVARSWATSKSAPRGKPPSAEVLLKRAGCDVANSVAIDGGCDPMGVAGYPQPAGQSFDTMIIPELYAFLPTAKYPLRTMVENGLGDPCFARSVLAGPSWIVAVGARDCIPEEQSGTPRSQLSGPSAATVSAWLAEAQRRIGAGDVCASVLSGGQWFEPPATLCPELN